MSETPKVNETIRAIVNPRWANNSFGPMPWQITLTLWIIAIRRPGAAPEQLWFVARCPVPLFTAASWRKRFARGEAIELDMVGFSPDRLGLEQARAKTMRVCPADPELRAVAAPVLDGDTIDTQFGPLVRAPYDEHYLGRFDWHGTEIDLRIEASHPAARASALADAKALHSRWPTWHAQLRARVEEELLPLWLDWNDESDGHVPIDTDALMAFLHLEEIWFTGNGEVNLTYDPSGQFTDHSVEVWGTIEGGPEKVDIQG